MGWTRQNMQTNKIKNKMEDALCRVCWEQAVNVTSLRIEGTTTIIVDNKDVILIQLDQVKCNAFIYDNWFLILTDFSKYKKNIMVFTVCPFFFGLAGKMFEILS